jgi:acyl-[acyl carrier protein]--UDP-N-acetylglucosamine O-acyltransferase
MSLNTIHPSSVIHNCTLGENIDIGPFCFISDSHIGDNVIIEGNVRVEKSTLRGDVSLLW